ncbi:MAG: hypothetical protein ABSH13_22265, partial [Candidatus Acidiferrum sp.]
YSGWKDRACVKAASNAWRDSRSEKVADPLASVEGKLVAAILNRIRSRRRRPSASPDDPHADSAAAVGPAKLREALFSDFEAVHALKQRWGLIPDSFGNWTRLWRDNPALKHCPQALPIGWVLEADGRVVGYLGNIASVYHFGGKKLLAVTGHGLVVEPAHRMLSFTLNAAFYRQPFVDLYLTTTAIEAVGRIAKAFRSSPLPQLDYEVLFWVLRSQPFAQEVIAKLQLGPGVSRLAGALATLAVGTDKVLRRRWPRRRESSLTVRQISVAEIGDDFQTLWEAKLHEAPRLLADRSPGTLRWHCQTPDDKGSTALFCCYSGEELLGYIVVRSDPVQTRGVRRSMVADMIAKNDDPATLNALCAAAHQHGKRIGSHILEILGFPPSIRAVCSQSDPFLRKYPSCPFYYKTANPSLHEALTEPSLWYASPFDGDTTLMPLLGRTNE